MKKRFLNKWLCGLIIIVALLFACGCASEIKTGMKDFSSETAVDTQAPTITPNDLTVEYGTTLNYSDLAAIEDNSPNEIEVSVSIPEVSGIIVDEDSKTIVLGSVGTFSVELTATDVAGNTSTGKTEIVVEDHVQPVLTLAKASFSLTVGDAAPNYASGVTASDNADGDLTETISIDTSKVNLNVAGTYEVTYTVQDNSENSTSEKATVTVTEPVKIQTQTSDASDTQVMITRTGECYHTHKCGNGNYFWVTLEEALSRGLRPCKKCY